MRKFLGSLLLALVILLTLIAPAYAVERRTGVVQKVDQNETIDDDLVMGGKTVTIDGTVNGDVFAGASSLVVNGTVNGDLFVTAGTVDIRGVVTGSVIFLGGDIFIRGRVERSLITAGASVSVEQAGSIGHSWISAVDHSEMLGTIGRGVMAYGSQIKVGGRIGRELTAMVDQLEVGPAANIAGPVTYYSYTDAQIAPGAATGEVVRHQLSGRASAGPTHWFLQPWLIALKFGGFLLVGLVLLALFPRQRTAFPDLIVQRPWQTALAGFLTLIALPVGAVLLMVTVIGLPLGILLLIAYPALIYAGQILIAWTVGHFAANRVPGLQGQSWLVIFLLGALLTTVLTELPRVGGILAVAAVFYGLGGLWFTLVRRREA